MQINKKYFYATKYLYHILCDTATLSAVWTQKIQELISQKAPAEPGLLLISGSDRRGTPGQLFHPVPDNCGVPGRR